TAGGEVRAALAAALDAAREWQDAVDLTERERQVARQAVAALEAAQEVFVRASELAADGNRTDLGVVFLLDSLFDEGGDQSGAVVESLFDVQQAAAELSRDDLVERITGVFNVLKELGIEVII